MSTRVAGTARDRTGAGALAFRIELRRSVALPAATFVLLLGLLSVLFLFAGLQPAFGQWTGFSGVMRDSLEFLCPVALGAGAWQGWRESRSGAAELISTTARPAWHRVVPVAGALAATLTVAYLLMFAFGAVQVAGNAAYQQLGWIPAQLVGVLALLAAGWLGLGLGALLPSVFTAPMATVAGLLALRLLGFGVTGKAALLGPSLHLRDDFGQITTQVSLAQVLWFGGLAVGGLVLAMTAGRRRLLAVPVIGAGLTAALLLFPATKSAAYVTDPAATALVCTSDAPRVCVAEVHADALDDLVGPARDALRLLAPLAAAPDSVAERTLPAGDDHEVKPQPSDVDLFGLLPYELDDQSQPTVSREDLMVRLLEGAGTTSCVQLPPIEARTRADMRRLDREYTARELSAALLLGKPLPTFSTQAAQNWPALHALPPAEQQRRLSAVRLASLSCQGDLLDILTGNGAH